MSLGIQPPISGFGEVPLPRRISVAQYHEMLRAGILQSGDSIELLEGLLVSKMTKHPPHVLATEQTRDALSAAIPPGCFVRSQEPMTTSDSEPEADVMVVRGTRRDYIARHPSPAEIGTIVEVSDDSLAKDRGPKKRVYAREGIAYYWIVNLVDRQVEVYSEPTGPADVPDYRQRRDFGENEQVPLVMEGQEVALIAVADLLP